MLKQLLDILDNMPPLSSFRNPTSFESLSLPEIALLSSLLLAARVRLETVAHIDRRCHGAWAEVKVVRKTHDWGFDCQRRQHGVREAFHGSSAENWHSICHYGLQNMSQTRHEKHGAAFGDGVYLSTDSALSREFSKKKVERHQLHRSSSFLKYTSDKNASEFQFEIVCRCDVINLDSNFVPRIGHSTKSNVDYLVVKDESHISINSILLFTTPKFCETVESLTATERLNKEHGNSRTKFRLYFYPLLLALLLLLSYVAILA